MDCLIIIEINWTSEHKCRIQVKGMNNTSVCWQTGANFNYRCGDKKEQTAMCVFQLARQAVRETSKIPGYYYPFHTALIEVRGEEVREDYSSYIMAFKKGLEIRKNA